MIPYQKRWPTPEQIHTWLGRHGWTPQSLIPADPGDGIEFYSEVLADDGEPFMVCAPRAVEAEPNYGLCVAAIVTTAAGLEDRPEMDVFNEMLALELAQPAAPPAARALAQSSAPAPTSD